MGPRRVYNVYNLLGIGGNLYHLKLNLGKHICNMILYDI